jgi:hypothetical protein
MNETDQRLQWIEEQNKKRAREQNRIAEEQNRLVEEQNWALEEQAQAAREVAEAQAEIARSIDSQNALLETAEQRKEAAAYKATEPQRRARWIAEMEQCMAYAKKNNLTTVYVCVPGQNLRSWYPYAPTAFEMINDETRQLSNSLTSICSKYQFSASIIPIFDTKRGFIDPYINHDRGIDSTHYGFTSKISLKKGELRSIKKAIPVNADMCRIPYKSGFALLPTGNVVSAQTDGNPDKIITIAEAPYIIWLKNSEIGDYIQKMNKFIISHKEVYRQRLTDCEKKADSIERMNTIKTIWEVFLKFLPAIIVLAFIVYCSSR